MTWQERYLQRFYDRSRGWRDGTELFHALCAEHLPAGGKILEIGAGPSNDTSRYLATIGELHGVDPDSDVTTNDALSGAHVIDGDRFPFGDAELDGCVSNYVIEHVEKPVDHLREVCRVLRPGARYVFRMPNRFHYVTLVSAFTPHWVHLRLANWLRNKPEDAHDPYPTVYRMNSRRAVRHAARQAGLDVVRLDSIEREPMYGLASRPLFLAFMVYERIVNSSEAFAPFRANILGVLARPLRKGS